MIEAPDYISLVRWCLSHQDDPPLRIHSRHIGDGGYLDFAHEFASWLDGAESQVTYGDGRSDYRYPMRRAIEAAGRVPAAHGLPRHDEAVRALVRAAGDLSTTASVLAPKYPLYGHPVVAKRHLQVALTAVWRLYRVTPSLGLDR